MDEINSYYQFRQRTSDEEHPQISERPFCKTLKVALNEIVRNRGEVEQERGWKLLSASDLHRPLGGGKVAKSKFIAPVGAFYLGDQSGCRQRVAR